MKDWQQRNFIFQSQVACKKDEISINQIIMYDEESEYGFVNETGAYPVRKLEGNRLIAKKDGIYITEDDTTIQWNHSEDYNFGGIIFRVRLPKLGAYHIEITRTKDSDQILPSVCGMNGHRLLDHKHWDSACLIEKNNYAEWTERTWNYDYVAGRYYLDIEVEPDFPYKEKPMGVHATIGIEKISITYIKKDDIKKAHKPSLFLMGDSTVKSYIYEEAGMSGWGQIFGDLFDKRKVHVINYSMGGRSFFNMYHEGRTNEILLTAHEGDYLLLQSGHNDESVGPEKGPYVRYGRGNDEQNLP